MRTDEELVRIIMSQQDRAVDYANTSLQEFRRKAWNRYLCRPRGDEMEGRSTVLDTSIRDTVHALHSTIMPTYDCSHLIDYPPAGPDDEDQADAEARALNRIVRSNANLMEIGRAVKDALLFRNGVIKVEIEEITEAVIRRWPDDTAKQALAALKADGADADIVGSDNGLTSIRVMDSKQQARIRAIEPAYFYVDPNHSQSTLNDCKFMSERFLPSRSDLLEMGISRKVVDALPSSPDEGTTSGVGMSNTDIQAKFLDGQADIGESGTWDSERVECFYVHMTIDMDGDGISEKWRFLVSNNRLLDKQPVTFFPYASGTGWEVPHRWSGLSCYDLLANTESERTNARRQMADNLNFANNQRPIADPGQVSWDDILAGAPGRPIKRKEGAQVDWMPFTDITSNSIQFLSYMDGVRSEQAGAALDMASSDVQAMKDVSGISAEMQLGPSEQMAAHVSRTLANTLVKTTFVLLHRAMREQWQGPLMYTKAGEWQQTNPAEWPSRDEVNINVALSPGERRRKASHLMTVVSMQMQLISGGAANIAVNYSGLHKSLYDWLTSVDLSPDEGYFIDPDSQEGMAAMQAAAEAAAEPQIDPIEEAKLQLDSQDQQNEMQRHTDEMQFKYTELGQDSEIEEARLVESGRVANITAESAATPRPD